MGTQQDASRTEVEEFLTPTSFRNSIRQEPVALAFQRQGNPLSRGTIIQVVTAAVPGPNTPSSTPSSTTSVMSGLAVSPMVDFHKHQFGSLLPLPSIAQRASKWSPQCDVDEQLMEQDEFHLSSTSREETPKPHNEERLPSRIHGFSSRSRLVPMDASTLSTLTRCYKGGFTDSSTSTVYPTVVQRRAFMFDELYGSKPANGDGLLWRHPSVANDTPMPLGSFPEMHLESGQRVTGLAATQRLQFCKTTVSEIPKMLSPASRDRSIDLSSNIAAAANALGLIRISAVFLEIEVQLRDLDVLQVAPQQFLHNLDVQDIHGYRKEFEHHCAALHSVAIDSPMLHNHDLQNNLGFPMFVQGCIEDNIKYCCRVATFAVAHTIELLEKEQTQ